MSQVGEGISLPDKKQAQQKEGTEKGNVEVTVVNECNGNPIGERKLR